MFKRLFFLVLITFSFVSSGKAQCPLVYNYLGNLSSNPYWLSCSGSTLYTLNFQSNTSWGAHTIIWGDGNPNQVGGSYIANTIISHTYTSAVPDTFVVTLLVPSLGCTLTGVVVMEKPVNAVILIPPGGTTQACAPAVLQFSNSSTDNSETTHYQWNYGDGTPLANFSYTNAGTIVTHTFAPGSVNCATSVTLKAWNYCSMGVTNTAVYNPIQIYTKDNATILPNKFISCWPDNIFTFSNTTVGNCVAQGNTFQRQEYWNLGNYWAMPGDSIRNWSPWPPITSFSVAYPAPGTYSIMLRDSNLCGVDTAILSVIILNAPVAGVIAPPAPLCQNTSITFTNSSGPGYSYMWDFGVGAGFANLGPGNKTFTYTNPGTYTVQVAAFIAGGGASCTNTANVVINILPGPTVNFTNSPSFGCTNLTNVSFTETSVGGVAWNWDFGNGNISNLQVPPNQNYIGVGSYVITLSVTAPNTCVNTKTAAIIVHPNPVANFSPTNACESSVTNFTNTSTVTGTNAITSFTWDFGDATPLVFTQNPSHTYTLPATYSVQLTVSTAFCSGAVTKTVLVNPKPLVSYVMSSTVGCTPFNVTFSNTTTGATSYLWDFGTVPTSTSILQNPAFTFTNGTQSAIFYTVSLYAVSLAGCTDSSKRVLSVLPAPANSFTTNLTSGCSPININFTNTTIGATTYSWNFGDGNSDIGTNPSHTYTNTNLVSQSNTVTLVATNSLGCSSTSSQVITVFPQPVFSITMVPPNGCAPLSVNFPAIAGLTTYTWNFGDGSPVSTSSNPTHVFTNTTVINIVYTTTLIGANAFGCVDTAYASPEVFPSPIAIFSVSPASGCSPLAVTFTNSSFGNDTDLWNFDNGQTSVINSPAITFSTSPGSSAVSYSVKLLVGNFSNCFDSVVHVVNLFANPKAEFALDTPACAPKIITFTNTSLGATSYSWNFGNGAQSTATNPTQTYTNGGATNQNYSVSLIAVNSDNCRDTLIVPFVLHPQAIFNMVASPDSGCSPLKVFFPVINGVQQYQWTFGDGGFGSFGNINHSFLNQGTTTKSFTVQLIAKDENGCADTSQKTFKVFPVPVAMFIADPLTVFIPNQAVSFSNQSTGGSTFAWTFGDGGTSGQDSPLYTYTIPGEYQVTLITISDKGCRDTFALADKIIALDQNNVQVPNAFTPNTNASPGSVFDPKDKSNDIFHANMKGVDKFTLSIYSRWGELMFETKNPAEGWDGYYKGKVCAQDIYVWKIDATFTDGNKFNKVGDVLLIR